MNKKAAIYLRVSTQEQTEGYSLEEQREKMISYCKIMDYDVYDVYTDPGYSGSNLNRPGIKQLLNDINDFDFVLVYKLDRLSRSQKDTLYLLEDEFLIRNVNLISISESFDTSTSFGRAMVGMLSVFAQLERENIRERMQMGKEGRAKAGLFNASGQIPIGYDYIDGLLIINEYEAMQVKLIANMYISGASINSIGEYLKANKYRTKYGVWKSSQTLYNMLFSELYRGNIKFKDEDVYDGQHKAIIDEDLAEKIDIEKARRGTTGNSSLFKAKFALTGLLQCKVCGAKMFAYNRRGKHFYTCYSVSRSAGHMIKDPNCSNKKKWATEELESIIKKELNRISLDESYFEEQSSKTKAQCNLEQELNTITKRKKELDQQIKKLMDLYQYEDIPVSEIRDRINELSQEKKSLKSQISLYESKLNEDMYDFAFIQKISRDLIKSWNVLDQNEIRKILSLLIKRIEVDNNEIAIIWAF